MMCGNWEPGYTGSCYSQPESSAAAASREAASNIAASTAVGGRAASITIGYVADDSMPTAKPIGYLADDEYDDMDDERLATRSNSTTMFLSQAASPGTSATTRSTTSTSSTSYISSSATHAVCAGSGTTTAYPTASCCTTSC